MHSFVCEGDSQGMRRRLSPGTASRTAQPSWEACGQLYRVTQQGDFATVVYRAQLYGFNAIRIPFRWATHCYLSCLAQKLRPLLAVEVIM